MVSNVARLTSALRSSVLEEEVSSPASLEPTLAEKIDTARRDLAENGFALFTDEHGRRFRIVRKPA
jgi:hypothetical protein